jgi:hypothetical protein
VLGDISPMGWCKLFSREMRGMVADASSFNGGGGGPSLALDFMTPGTLSPLITFTRASTATYFDSAGVMQTAAVNTPRWDYDPVTLALRGLLLEDQRTNLLPWSSDPTVDATWLKSGITSAAPTATANQTTAPDGTLTADRVNFPAVSAVGAVSLTQQTLAATAAIYTFSVYLKGAVGGEQTYISIRIGTTPYYTSPRITLTTSWQRYVVTSAAPLTTAAWFFGVGTDLRDVSQTSTPAQNIYVWGAQFELGDFATSYIPTTTVAVTRSIDSCLILPANMGWFTGTPGGSWFVEFDYFDATPTNSRVIGRSNVSGGITPVMLATGPPISGAQYDGAVALATTNVPAANASTKIVTTWTAGQAKVCTNGGTVASSAALSSGYAALTTLGVRFMAVTTANTTDNTSGHLRNVRYWPTVLTDAQMQAMTAP